jgi:hypothetical protein
MLLLYFFNLEDSYVVSYNVTAVVLFGFRPSVDDTLGGGGGGNLPARVCV